MRLPRMSRHVAGPALRRSTPENDSASARTMPGGGVKPMMARPVLRLARATLADDAEPLAPELEGDAAHRLDDAGAGWDR